MNDDNKFRELINQLEYIQRMLEIGLYTRYIIAVLLMIIAYSVFFKP